MKCVVTGGRGFIGSHIVDALRDAKHEVEVIDLAPGARNVDILDTPKLVEAFQEIRPDFVYHIAAIADARAALNDPVKAVRVNIEGTASVYDAARKVDAKRVVLASTAWVANAMRPGAPGGGAVHLDETEPFLAEGGGHVYTTTKIASEHLAHDFKKLYGLNFTVLRYGIPYGPRMWPGLVLRSFLDRAFAKQPLTIFGDGSATRRFVYIADLARAHALATTDKAANQVYNLEGSRAVSIKQVAELVSKLTGGAEIQYKEEPTRAGELAYGERILTNTKALRDLGWRPEVEFEEGVRRTVEWYKRDILHA